MSTCLKVLSLSVLGRHYCRKRSFTNDRLGFNGLHLLSSLIAKERQPSTSAFRDDSWTQTTEDTCLVILARVQSREHSIIVVGESSLASQANTIDASGS